MQNHAVCPLMRVCDLPLAVMNVSFGSPTFSAIEGSGFVEIVLTKTSGAIGPVSVNLFTRDGNDTGRVL